LINDSRRFRLGALADSKSERRASEEIKSG
jgi:hypothetical protein